MGEDTAKTSDGWGGTDEYQRKVVERVHTKPAGERVETPRSAQAVPSRLFPRSRHSRLAYGSATGQSVDFFGREVLVFIEEGRPKAVLNICAHFGGPLRLEDTKLVCEWHVAECDRKRGACLKGPGLAGLRADHPANAR